MSVAFVFSGQGVQNVGMGKDLYDAGYTEVFDLIGDVKDICFNGPKELLDDTYYSQLSIVAVSLTLSNILKENGINCMYCAGLSLGEYSALCYSGVLSLKDTLSIVEKRGSLMSKALKDSDSGMVAVIKSDEETIKEVIKDKLEIANYNSYNQIVITGKNKYLDEAILEFKKKNIRCIRLNVSGGFHSSLLKDASKELRFELDKYDFKKQNVPVVFNVTAKFGDDVKDLLERQIKSSVRFYQSIEFMIEKGVDTFIEIGSLKVLSGFIKNINKDVKVISVGNLKEVMEVVNG